MEVLTEQDLIQLLRAHLSIDFSERQVWVGDGQGWQMQKTVRVWIGAELINETELC